MYFNYLLILRKILLSLLNSGKYLGMIGSLGYPYCSSWSLSFSWVWNDVCARICSHPKSTVSNPLFWDDLSCVPQFPGGPVKIYRAGCTSPEVCSISREDAGDAVLGAALWKTQKQLILCVGNDWEHSVDGSRPLALALLSARKEAAQCKDMLIAQALIASEFNSVSLWALFYCVESPTTKEINSHSLINTYQIHKSTSDYYY